jgi:hypothetical protein
MKVYVKLVFHLVPFVLGADVMVKLDIGLIEQLGRELHHGVKKRVIVHLSIFTKVGINTGYALGQELGVSEGLSEMHNHSSIR